MKTVIMAGGLGTRISEINPNIPKPLIKVDGIPILEHEIICLAKQNFTDVLITVGYLANQIIDYFGDGKRFGVNIEYFVETTPLGTAGALFKLKNLLKDDFLLINADSLFNVDLERFAKYHKEKHGYATLLTHPNSHPFDSSIVVTDSNGCVKKWYDKSETKPEWYKNRVNAGIHILSPVLLEKKFENEKVDLDKDLLHPLAGTGLLFAYDTIEYVKDMGTPQRLLEVEKDFKNGIYLKKNLLNKQKAIFLDRDGTINKDVGFLYDIDKMSLIDDAAKAIKLINESGYLAIVVTNQPIIARGEATIDELTNIHNKMETLLGKQNAYLDSIYFCPHHPDKGFAGERAEYKIECDCRKPKPGLLLKAAADYNIDLTSSWMIGDKMNDILAGVAAKCKTVYIGNSDCQIANIKANGLLDAVQKILKDGTNI